jgi:tetratricopeptide (TPR) repeat protein
MNTYRRSLTAILFGIAAVGGALWFWHGYRSGFSDRLISAARNALDQGDRHEADRLLNVLAQEEATEHVACLRGEMALREARVVQERAVTAAKWDYTVRTLQVATEVVGMLCQSADTGRDARQLGMLFLAEVSSGSPVWQQRRDLENQAKSLLREALREYQHVKHREDLAVRSAAESGECLVRLRELGSNVPMQEAVRRLRLAAERNPDDVQTHRWLASLYLDMKAPNNAVSELEEVARLDPSDGRPQRIIGYVLKDYRQFERSKEAYEAALKRHLEAYVVAEVIGEVGEVYLETGHPAKALENLERYPAQFRQGAYYLALRAECLWQLGHADEATKLVDQALSADATLLPALKLRALIYLAQEQPQAALPLLLRYTRVDPVHNQTRSLLAQAYRMLGDTVNSQNQMKMRDKLYAFNQELIRLNTELLRHPQDDQLRVKIAELWLTIDQRLEARNWIRSAIDVNPNNLEAKRALERLDVLPSSRDQQ